MGHMSAEVKKYMQSVPPVWDDVHFLDGYPGKYYVVARRAGKKWYVAGVNADSIQRELSMDLSFIAKKKTGTLFYSNTPALTPGSAPVSIRRKQKNTVTMKANDGFVMVFE